MEGKLGLKPITHDQVAELQETFYLFDHAGEGIIEISRLKELMFELAPGLTEDFYTRLISEAKLQNTDTINFAQFFLMVSTMRVILSPSGDYERDQLIGIFTTFDPRQTGYIEMNRFLQIMLEEGKPLSQAEGKELILHLHRFGCLRKGKVNYRKFISRVFASESSSLL